MKQLNKMWLIALKDLKIFTKDRAAAFFFIVFPLLMIILFNTLLKGVGGEDQRLELHLVTQEAAGGLSHQIISGMETKDESLLAPGEPRIVWDKDFDTARQAVQDKKLAGFIAFGGFHQAVSSGSGTTSSFADADSVLRALNGLAGAISSR
jgi:ABC-type Na+ efflux pump permease subunit